MTAETADNAGDCSIILFITGCPEALPAHQSVSPQARFLRQWKHLSHLTTGSQRTLEETQERDKIKPKFIIKTSERVRTHP